MPYSATPSARIRQARPNVPIAASAVLPGLELRRALRHERVGLPDEDRALALDGDDDLAARTERIGHRAGVPDGHGHRALRIADAEGERVPAAPHAARHDLPAELVRLARLGRRELARDPLRA